jgi:hypothetical protein
MNAKSKLVDPVKGVSNLVRPRYSPGLLLRDDDLTQAVDYTRQLSRLLFRSFFGCGVVCGLEVNTPEGCGGLNVTVSEGLALDCHGDPIHVTKTETLKLDIQCVPQPPNLLWVLIRHYNKCCTPRTAVCASEEDETATVCTREMEGYEIVLTNVEPDCACYCPDNNSSQHTSNCKCVDPALPCYQDHYDGKCGCTCGNCDACDCEWVVLAKLMKNTNDQKWNVNHLVRRFIRPVLMRDPKSEPAESLVKNGGQTGTDRGGAPDEVIAAEAQTVSRGRPRGSR